MSLWHHEPAEKLAVDKLFKPLVYGIFRNGKYLYIGASRHGLSRLDYHRRSISFEKGDEIHVWYPPAKEIFGLELYLINYYKPELQKDFQRVSKLSEERLKIRNAYD